MLGVRPVRLLVKAPVPSPSSVFESSMSGFSVVLQQTPRAVTAAPPSAVTLPEQVAVVVVISVTSPVVTVGASCSALPSTQRTEYPIVFLPTPQLSELS